MPHDEALTRRLRDLLQDEPGVSEKPMFGSRAFLINGNLAVCAANPEGLIVRVGRERAAELIAEQGVEPLYSGQRLMPGWVRVPGDRVADDGDLRAWVDLGAGQARARPPK